jgi:hypothetical protein
MEGGNTQTYQTRDFTIRLKIFGWFLVFDPVVVFFVCRKLTRRAGLQSTLMMA